VGVKTGPDSKSACLPLLEKNTTKLIAEAENLRGVLQVQKSQGGYLPPSAPPMGMYELQ